MRTFTKVVAVAAMTCYCVSVAAQQPAAPKTTAQTTSATLKSTTVTSAALPKLKLNDWVMFTDDKWKIGVDLSGEKPAVGAAATGATFSEIRIYLYSEETNRLLGGKVVSYTVGTDGNNYLTFAGNHGGNFDIKKGESAAKSRVVDYIEMALAAASNAVGKNIKIIFK